MKYKIRTDTAGKTSVTIPQNLSSNWCGVYGTIKELAPGSLIIYSGAAPNQITARDLEQNNLVIAGCDTTPAILKEELKKLKNV